MTGADTKGFRARCLCKSKLTEQSLHHSRQTLFVQQPGLAQHSIHFFKCVLDGLTCIPQQATPRQGCSLRLSQLSSVPIWAWRGTALGAPCALDRGSSFIWAHRRYTLAHMRCVLGRIVDPNQLLLLPTICVEASNLVALGSIAIIINLES